VPHNSAAARTVSERSKREQKGRRGQEECYRRVHGGKGRRKSGKEEEERGEKGWAPQVLHRSAAARAVSERSERADARVVSGGVGGAIQR